MNNKNKKIIIASAFSTIILALSAVLYIGMSPSKKKASMHEHSHNHTHDSAHHHHNHEMVPHGKDTQIIQLDYKNPKIISQGEKIYKNSCSSCHGVNLEGEPNWQKRDAHGYLPAPPQNGSGHTWHHSSSELFETTKHGRKKTRMPAFKNILSDKEIIAVLSFIKSQWPADLQEKHNKIENSHQ